MVGFSEVLSSIIGFAGVCLGSKEIAGPSYDIEMDYMQKGPPCEWYTA